MASRFALVVALMWSVAAHAAAQECDDDGGLPEDDGVECTVDVCARLSTVHLPNDALCDDGEPCTNDLCTLLGCENTAISACIEDASVEPPDAEADAASGDGDGDSGGDGDGAVDAATVEHDAATESSDSGEHDPRDAAAHEHDASTMTDAGADSSNDDGCSCRVGVGARSRSAGASATLGCAIALLSVLGARRSRRRFSALRRSS